MADLEEKLSAIMNDPQMMQQLSAMAQNLGLGQGGANSAPAEGMPDPALLQQLSGIAGQGAVDKREQALLGALGAYLSRERISRLERAMRAAKMAKFATAALGSGGAFLSSGR